jgi:RND family efflux transporter MFP subunit
VSLVVYEQYRTQRDTARARLNAAKQALEAASNAARQNNQAIKSAQAAVEAARTQVGTAEQAVADTIIRAPFSGFISNRPVAVGEYVTSATPVATLLRVNPIKLQIQVAEADVPFISIGRAISIEVDAYKDRKFSGAVTAVNPAIDPTSRAAVVEAAIENGDNALRSGMFCDGQNQPRRRKQRRVRAENRRFQRRKHAVVSRVRHPGKRGEIARRPARHGRKRIRSNHQWRKSR